MNARTTARLLGFELGKFLGFMVAQNSESDAWATLGKAKYPSGIEPHRTIAYN